MLQAIIYIYLATWPLLTLVWIYDFGRGVGVIDVIRTVAVLLIPTTIFINAILQKQIRTHKAVVIWMLFLGYSIINVYVVNGPLGVREIVRDSILTYMVPLAMYFVITNLSFMLDIKCLVISVIISGIITAGVGLLEWFAGKNLIGPAYTGMDLITRDVFFRTNGPFHDGISYSTVVLMHIPFAYYFMKKQLISKRLWIFCVAFFALGSLVAYARSTMVALLLTGIILALRVKVGNLFATIYMMVFGGIMVFIAWELIASSQIYTKRIGEASDVIGRYLQNIHAWKMFLQNPFFGLGYGNWQKIDRIYGIHNSFMAQLAEGGLIGFTLFMLYYASILLKNIKKLFQERIPEALKTRFAYIVIIFIVANAIQLMMNPQFVFTLLVMFAIFEIDTMKRQKQQISTISA